MFDERVYLEENAHRRELIAKAQHALIVMTLGNDEEAVRTLSPLTSESKTNSEETREIMLLLFSECSAMVTALGDGGTTPVKVQVFNEQGAEVSIDQADPPIRTAVRTLLAEVHGNTEAATEQVEIALGSAARNEVDSLIIQALRWTIRLSTECLNRNLPVSDWIVDVLAD